MAINLKPITRQAPDEGNTQKEESTKLNHLFRAFVINNSCLVPGWA